jgi:hypothetical protein
LRDEGESNLLGTGHANLPCKHQAALIKGLSRRGYFRGALFRPFDRFGDENRKKRGKIEAHGETFVREDEDAQRKVHLTNSFGRASGVPK